MIPYSPQVELLVSALNLLFVVITILWKTVGLRWIPWGLGPAWEDQVLAEDGFFWPRHNRLEAQYLWFHLMLYCVGGTVAQIASWIMVHNPHHSAAPTFFGGFHVSIALYHIAVAFRWVQGKSVLLDQAQIWKDYPWIRTCSQIMFVMEWVVAGHYFWTSPGMTRAEQQQKRQQKISLDVLSLLNFIPMTVFTLSLAFLGDVLNDEWKAFWVNVTCYGILPSLVLALEFVRNWQYQRSLQLKIQ